MRRTLFLVALVASGLVAGAAPAGAVDPITVTTSTESVVEGPAGEYSTVTVTVSLSSPAPASVVLKVVPAAGTARPGADYLARQPEARIVAGTSVRTVVFRVVGDARDEIDESFTVSVPSPPPGYTAGAASTVTIVDDDGDTYLSVTDREGAERDGRPFGRSYADFRLSAPFEHDITVTFATFARPPTGDPLDRVSIATFARDFAPFVGTVTFTRGKTVVTRALDLPSDDLVEADEHFEVRILDVASASPPHPAVIVVDDTGDITIHDDDRPPAPAERLLIATYPEAAFEPPARLIELADAGAIDRVALRIDWLSPWDAAHLSTMIGALHDAGILVDAYGGHDGWASDSGDAMWWVQDVADFNAYSPNDFDGIHLNVQPWHLEGFTPAMIFDGLTAMFDGVGACVCGGTLVEVAHAAGLSVELSIDHDVDGSSPGRPNVLPFLAGYGVDGIAVHTGTDSAYGSDGAISRAQHEMAQSGPLALDVRVLGNLDEVLDFSPMSFWDDAVEWLELQGLAVDAAFASYPGYAGGGVRDLFDLDHKLSVSGRVPMLHDPASPTALFVRTPIELLNIRRLMDFTYGAFTQDLLVDAGTIGSSPATDAAFADLLAWADWRGLNVFATGRDPAWLGDPAAAGAWVDAVAAFNDAHDLDFDGVHLAVPGTDEPALLSLVATVGAAVPPMLTFDVSIPPTLSSATLTAILASADVDGITIEADADTDAAALAAVADETAAAEAAGKGFRVALHFTPREPGSSTLADESLSQASGVGYAIEAANIGATSWKGLAFDDYDALYLEAITVPAPPAAPFVLEMTGLDLLDPTTWLTSDAKVYAGPTAAAPPEAGCPPATDYCFAAEVGGSPPLVVFDAGVAQPPFPLLPAWCSLPYGAPMPPAMVSTFECGAGPARITYAVVNVTPGPPAPPPALQVSAGGEHTCALLAGVVRCWGEGGTGQLGGASTVDVGDDEEPWAAAPVDVGGMATQITAGDSHTCALLDTGAVRCWGWNVFGELGLGTGDTVGDDETPASVPTVDLGAGRTALAIDAGDDHTCAVLDDGNVRCWGANGFGQLGLGMTETVGDDETPASVPTVDLGAGRTARAVATGDNHSCALLDDGNVRCWGESDAGQLGYGNTQTIGNNESPGSVGPVDLGAGRTAVAITAGAFHTCAVLDDGSARCWGFGANGNLGYGTADDVGDNETPGSVPPIDVGAGRTAVTITAGNEHTCATLDDGSLRCWGAAWAGQIGTGRIDPVGDDETPASIPPVDLGPGRTVLQASAGGYHTCAVLDDGSLWCWGAAWAGQTGHGDTQWTGDDDPPTTGGPVAFAP